MCLMRGSLQDEEREKARERGRVRRRVCHMRGSLACLELLLVDGPGLVSVVALEGGLPVVDVFPQRPKLLVVDGARLVSVEHADHQPHCLRVEGSPRTYRMGQTCTM